MSSGKMLRITAKKMANKNLISYKKIFDGDIQNLQPKAGI